MLTDRQTGKGREGGRGAAQTFLSIHSWEEGLMGGVGCMRGSRAGAGGVGGGGKGVVETDTPPPLLPPKQR